MLNIQPVSKDTEHRFSFLKKHRKTPKLPRVKLHQTFASKGWNSCSAFDCETSDADEYNITSSPAKSHKASSEKQENNLDRKPMLVEISNIESIFKESKLKSYKGSHKKSPLSFHDFVQNVCEIENPSENYQRKQLISGSCNIQRVQASFQTKNLHIAEQYGTSYSKNLFSGFSLDKNKKSEKIIPRICINQSKFPKGNKSFISCSTSVKYIRKFSGSETSFLINEYDPVSDKKLVFERTCDVKHRNQSKCENLSKAFDNSECETSLTNDCSNTEMFSIKNYSNPLNSSKKGSYKGFAVLSDNPSKFQNLSEAFAIDFNTKKDIEENSDSDALLIKDESSPAKDSSKCNYRNIYQRNHSKFQNLCEVFTNNSVSGKSVANNPDCCEAFTIKNEFSTMNEVKSSLKRNILVNDINQNTFLNLSESFVSKSARNECLNKKISCETFVIQNESSPVNDHLLKKPLDSAICISSFEKDVNKNFPSEQESSAGIKSLTYDNKAFVQMLQSNFHDKTSFVDKGSKWVQSLHWSDQSQSKDINSENDQVGKKTRRNILPGGFAEQMLKLQRRERSERTIWNHKMNEIKKKAGNNYITLILRSVSHLEDIVVTRCSVPDTDEDNTQSILHNWNFKTSVMNSELSAPKASVVPSDNAIQNRNLTQVFVLFKENMFSKLQLKTRDMFVIYPPWQTIYMPSLHSHAILCTYFVDCLHKSMDVVRDDISMRCSFTDIARSVQAKKTECDVAACLSNSLFNSSDLFGKSVCVSARIQRIWENGILNEKIQNIFKIENYLSFSILLQTKDGTYLELKISSNCLPQLFHQFLSEAEGSCFTFYDLKVSHRYNLKKYPQLLKVIEYIQNENKIDATLPLSQRFCYQFIPNSFNKMPDEIAEENFPLYYNFEIKPLAVLQRNPTQDVRFSCIGKILFQKKEEIYISDESLLCSRFIKKYYTVKNLSRFKMHKQLTGGSIILIKEAVVNEDCLFIDQFSRCEILSSAVIHKRLLPYQSRLTKISLISSEHVLVSLDGPSNDQELVLVKGVIMYVDEDTAISWLECSFCSKENLLTDSKSVIYCEDCSCVVSKPVLKVKMEVTVLSSSLPNTEIKIQLLSSTVKKILKINEDDCQPQCNISDVLGKDIGTVPCCVQDVELMNSKKVYHLTEISCF